MSEIFKVEKPAGISRLREEAQEDPKMWQDANNIRFQHGITKKVDGYEEGLGESLVDPEIIVPLRDDDGLYYWWAYAGLNLDYPGTGHSHKFYRITNTIQHLDVTPDIFYELTTGRDYKWTGDTINGVPYLTYGVPYFYDAASSKFKMFQNIPRDAVGVPGDPGYDPNGGDPRVRFQVVRSYRNFLVGMNFDTDNYDGYFNSDENVDPDQYWGGWDEDIHQNAVWWSHSIIGKDIDAVWEDANSIKSSGWNFLGGTGGNIVDGRTLRDSFLIYRERSVWQMSYIGGVQIFAFKEVFNDIGCLGLDCVIEVDGQHLVVGQSDVYMHNGVRKTTLSDGIIRRELFGRINPEHTASVFITADYKNKEAWICIPTDDQDTILELAGLPDSYRGSCNLAYVYNWDENTWSKKDIPWLTGSIFTILSITEDDLSWVPISEGGPLNAENEAPKWLQSDLDLEPGVPATPYYPGNPNYDLGRYRAGVTWEEATLEDTWASSYFKYNPAEWGIAATSRSQKIFTKLADPLVGGNQDLPGESFSAFVEKTHMDMGESLVTKFASRVYPLVRNGEIDIYMYGSMSLEEGTVWGNTEDEYKHDNPAFLGTFDSRVEEHMACRVTGRYLHIKFVIPRGSIAELRGYHLEFSYIGKR